MGTVEDEARAQMLAAQATLIENLNLRSAEDCARLVRLDPDHAAFRLCESQRSLRQRTVMVLVLLVSWFAFGLVGWYRDGQQAEAYRLLEQNYMRETGKAPPKVTP